MSTMFPQSPRRSQDAKLGGVSSSGGGFWQRGMTDQTMRNNLCLVALIVVLLIVCGWSGYRVKAAESEELARIAAEHNQDKIESYEALITIPSRLGGDNKKDISVSETIFTKLTTGRFTHGLIRYFPGSYVMSGVSAAPAISYRPAVSFLNEKYNLPVHGGQVVEGGRILYKLGKEESELPTQDNKFEFNYEISKVPLFVEGVEGRERFEWAVTDSKIKVKYERILVTLILPDYATQAVAEKTASAWVVDGTGAEIRDENKFYAKVEKGASINRPDKLKVLFGTRKRPIEPGETFKIKVDW